MKFSDLTPSLPAKYSKLTQAQRARVRSAYIGIQKGKCWFCKGDLEEPARDHRPVVEAPFPRGFFDHPVHLHHCHLTDDTLGAVHAKCNAILWLYYGE